ncbi:HK97 gp10 family phage protein [Thermosipho globiformans]|uniref:HK97 gp10 family phage protein n=1 Tax=Thermosipho globiformans TaxID=380685 RepID=UPI000F8EEED9|nr:HK97 gp10 family phage protein [Thermosipho globiformans]
MIDISVDKKQLVKIRRYVSDDRFREVLRKVLLAAGMELEDMIVENIYERATNTGALAQRWTVKDLSYDKVKVFTNMQYAPFVEYGTKPHRAPFEPILKWVQQQLRIRGKKSKGVAWAVWRKIAKQGTPEKRYLRDALEDFNLNKWIDELIRAWENV